MDIVLDSNVFLADPWMRSQKMRMLLDFIHKIQGRMVLPQVVESEVRAKVERRFQEAASAVGASIDRADQTGLDDLPEFDPAVAASAAIDKWRRQFEAKVGKGRSPVIQIDAAAAAEAVERAAKRIAPCATKAEYRDALIWIGLLTFGQERSSNAALVFISQNTRDFADSDGEKLHPDLAEEATSAGVPLLYYSSLADFLEEHAKRFEFLDVGWVGERLDMDELEHLLKASMGRPIWGVRLRTLGFDDAADFYEAREFEVIERVLIDIDDVLVWKFDDDHIEISISCRATVEGQVICDLSRTPYIPRTAMENNMLEFEYPRVRTFGGYAEVGFTVAGSVMDDELHDVGIEEVYPI